MVEAEADVESEARRHKECKVLVSSGLFFLFLFRFFEVARQTACLVWIGLPPCVFWAALPLSNMLELDGPCLVRDIWISIIEAQI